MPAITGIHRITGWTECQLFCSLSFERCNETAVALVAWFLYIMFGACLVARTSCVDIM